MSPVSSAFFRVMAMALHHGFVGNPRIFNMLTPYTDLEQKPGSHIIDVPVWDSFTVKAMGGGCTTPCTANENCDDANATMISIPLKTRYVPTKICLGDLNIMSAEQRAGMVAQVITDLIRDFEIATYGSDGGVYPTLFTDSVFNGPGGSMPPIFLADSSAGYRQLANGISLAKAKDDGAGVAFLVSPALDGFIKSIPSRELERMLDGVEYIVVGNAAAYSVSLWGTTYTGRFGFVYPKNALAYAAPRLSDPNLPLTGYAGNFWAAMLDDASVPGKLLIFAHQFGLVVVRQGDIQMLVSP